MVNQSDIVIERLMAQEWHLADEIKRKILFLDSVWLRAMSHGGFPMAALYVVVILFLPIDFEAIDPGLRVPLALLSCFGFFAIGMCMARLFLQHGLNKVTLELNNLALDPDAQALLQKLDSFSKEADEIRKMNSILIKLDSSRRIRKKKIETFLKLAGIRHKLHSLPEIAP